MKSTDIEYHSTGVLLKILAVIVLMIGLKGHSAGFIALACGYWVASKNPWRYRIIINIGLILYFLQFVQVMYHVAFGTSSVPFINIVFPPIVFILLVIYYPSPYPAMSNAVSFILPTKTTVSWIDSYPSLFKKISGKGIIGTVEGLYFNSDAFNVLQEEGFLGFITAKDIIETAGKAGIRNGATLLDVGSGLGGPSCALAGEYDLHVTGIDLLERNVTRASSLSASRHLGGRCRYLRSNALYLPFKDASFDFVFGSDAWCHVPERDKLLQECRRVLKDKGTIFFFDWLMGKEDSEGFRFIYAFPPLETIESYSEKLRKSGFHIVCAKQRNDSLMTHVADLRHVLQKRKRTMIDRCGRELYDNWDIVSLYTWKMISEGRLGSGMFIAHKV